MKKNPEGDGRWGMEHAKSIRQWPLEFSEYERQWAMGPVCDLCTMRSFNYGCTLSGKTICHVCSSKYNGNRGRVTLRIPPAYTFAAYEQYPDKLARLMKQWPREKKYVALSGCAGAGKTNGLWAIAKAQAEKGILVRVVEADAVKQGWQATFDEKHPEPYFRDLKETPFLAFDDLPAATVSPGWVEQIHSLLNYRLNENLPTLLTLSSNVDMLLKTYGSAVCSRLSVFALVHLPNVDRRKQKSN